jgi:hypothetical protein
MKKNESNDEEHIGEKSNELQSKEELTSGQNSLTQLLHTSILNQGEDKSVWHL